MSQKQTISHLGSRRSAQPWILHLLCTTSLELAQGILKVRQRAFRFLDLCIVTPENVWVVGGLAQELGGLEDLALCLDVLPGLGNLLVQLGALSSRGQSGHQRGIKARNAGVRTMAAGGMTLGGARPVGNRKQRAEGASDVIWRANPKPVSGSAATGDWLLRSLLHFLPPA